MKIIGGKTNSGKTRYVVSNYLYRTLMEEDREVIYMGELAANTLIQLLKECQDKQSTYSREQFVGLTGKLIYYKNIDEIIEETTGKELIIIDQYLPEEEFKKLLGLEFKKTSRSQFRDLSGFGRIIVTEQLKANTDLPKGTLLDDGREVRFNPETFEILN